MKRLLRGIVIAAFMCSTSFGDLQYRCPSSLKINGYIHIFREHCFEFILRETTWDGASNDCKSKGGHLVVIRDKDTQNFIMSTLRTLKWSRNGIWLGATDRSSEMRWSWVTGESVNAGFSNWAPSQPSCHLLCFEDCALMRLDDRGRWHDYHCSWIENYSYICQYAFRPVTSTQQRTTTTTTTTTASTAVQYKSIAKSTPVMTLSPEEARTVMSLSSTTVNESFQQLLLEKHSKQVQLLGNAHMTGAVEDSQESDVHAGSLVGLVMGVLFGLCVGLCLAIFFFAHRRKKQKEELPTVVFANPYYGECGMPLNVAAANVDAEGEECCFGAAGGSATMTTAKVQSRSLPQTSTSHHFVKVPLSSARKAHHLTLLKTEVCRHGDGQPSYNRDLTSQDRELYGREVDGLIDNHYDYTTGENYYESLDNLRQTMEQNLQNEHLEDDQRYVPFVCGSRADH